MAVIAPTVDGPGITLQAAVATSQALVNATPLSSIVYSQYALQLGQLQVALVGHFMVTGWLNAGTILQTYQPLKNDKIGQALVCYVALLQALIAAAPPPNPLANGWTSPAASYAVSLYAAQIAVVNRIMDCPGATSAATMLATLTGFQSFPFEYSFTGPGYTDVDEDD